MKLRRLIEKVEPLDPGMDLDAQIDELQKRLEAAKRGIGITNKMGPGANRTKHRSRVMGNLNSIRGMLNNVIKLYAEFDKAAADYEAGGGYMESVDPEDFMDDCPRCEGTGSGMYGDFRKKGMSSEAAQKRFKESPLPDRECPRCRGEGYV